MPLIDLNSPASWPRPLQEFLDRHERLFADWEHRTETVSPGEYDLAIMALGVILRNYNLRGWHCTRLTDAEVHAIRGTGMVLPDREILGRRIDVLCDAGAIDSTVAVVLKARNQAGEQGRRGMIWFCFYPPRHAGESGIHRFFRYWGGEALYNSHEVDTVTAPVLARIGQPCLVEADVPIASLYLGFLPTFIVAKHLHTRGVKVSRASEVREHVQWDGYAVVPVSSLQIRRIIRFLDPEFAELTGHMDWHSRLNEGP